MFRFISSWTLGAICHAETQSKFYPNYGFYAFSAVANRPNARQLLRCENRLPSQTQNVKLFTGLDSEPERS